MLRSDSHITGFGYAFLSMALFATVPTISKLGLETLNVETFVFALSHYPSASSDARRLTHRNGCLLALLGEGKLLE